MCRPRQFRDHKAERRARGIWLFGSHVESTSMRSLEGCTKWVHRLPYCALENVPGNPAPGAGDEEFRVPEAVQRRSQRLTGVVPHIGIALQCQLENACLPWSRGASSVWDTVDHAFTLARAFAYNVILKLGHDAGDFHETGFYLIGRSIRVGSRAGVCSTQGDHRECVLALEIGHLH